MKKTIFKSTFIYIATLIVAACSIAYELLLANEISLAAGNTVVWYSLAIGSYLGFLGLGSLAYSGIFQKIGPEKRLFWVEVLLSFVGVSSAILIKFSHFSSIFALAHGFGAKSYIILFAVAFLLVALIGFLSGVELPVLMDVAKKDIGKNISNRILGTDYFGSLIGTIVFSMILIPNFNGIQIGAFVALLNFVVAINLLVFYKIEIFKKFDLKNSFFILVTVALVLVIIFPQKIEQFLAKKYYYYPQEVVDWKTFLGKTKNFPQVARKQTPYQTIDVVQPIEFGYSDLLVNAYIDNEKISEQPDDFVDKTLYLNGDYQLSTISERVYHEYFAHVPIQAADFVPSKILLLGGGDGLLLRELLKYPEVQKITQVELDQDMVDVAKKDPSLSAINKNSFSDPRIQLIFDDGFHYLQNNSEKFDAVYIDFPVPFDYNVSKLYSRELYYFANKAITDNGFLAVYAPFLTEFKDFNEEGWMEVKEEDTSWRQYYNTLKAAKFETILPFFVNLERDDMNARTMVEEFLSDRKDERGAKLGLKLDQELVQEKTQQEISEIMEKFSISMQESFIFAQKKGFKGKFNYADRGAEYAVMTKRRFFEAFQIILPKRKGIEWQYVNSIMKPTLPIVPLWRIRLPYNLNG